jgi:hypothetical protein
MYEMIKKNRDTHPSVLKVSQELDMKIFSLQKMVLLKLV